MFIIYIYLFRHSSAVFCFLIIWKVLRLIFQRDLQYITQSTSSTKRTHLDWYISHTPLVSVLLYINYFGLPFIINVYSEWDYNLCLFYKYIFITFSVPNTAKFRICCGVREPKIHVYNVYKPFVYFTLLLNESFYAKNSRYMVWATEAILPCRT